MRYLDLFVRGFFLPGTLLFCIYHLAKDLPKTFRELLGDERRYE